mmetsp:Transcript_26719/g.64106  ORF Transcript_26719/g.64106 Transcript_26719/m.64106 type:complete len:225 (-) Transcript_26719:146-820(-)|eukprot:CAMPEP_0181105000 /NCGR_PEP_ID=MMETSP1071-20121207/15732_1 /TAXON_ID=35127 /ORGANISM="Thalassiosira sp., Strain NH16" /LENGTH=224 /DNA_ID=CAMNT_0023188245 /DNA_START=221 /DNA_END=895 /DNA_ORIENTATION=+
MPPTAVMKIPLLTCLLCFACHLDSAHSFVTSPKSRSNNNGATAPSNTIPSKQHPPSRNNRISLILSAQNNSGGEDKFSFFQRIESIKTAALGAISSGIIGTPVLALHDLPISVAQWEFDTDMGSLQGALFAIVYRYCVREDDDNDMLNMGVIGAFVFVRTLSRIRVPSYCTAVPLDCGDPLGYLDWDMLGQLVWNGAEGVAIFGGAAAAMEIAYKKGWISKFPN